MSGGGLFMTMGLGGFGNGYGNGMLVFGIKLRQDYVGKHKIS